VTRHRDSEDPGEREAGGPPTVSSVDGSDLLPDKKNVCRRTSRGRIACFGPFRLHVTERLLEKDGEPIKIGSRALDILTALLDHAPEVVAKHDLIQRVWGKIVVDDGSLRFQVAGLRKQLCDEGSTASLIINIPGRGYCFAGAVSWSDDRLPPQKTLTIDSKLPEQPLLFVGRDRALQEVAALLTKHRFVSLVGPGGIGKTTVALTLAHGMLADFDGAVHFLDLVGLDDTQLIANLLATHLGLVAVSEQPLPVILAFLSEQRTLLVFDNCEHVIEAATTLAENIFGGAPQTSILVTSREALRAEGEHVYHLPPLECPPDDESLTGVQALEFSAVRLFVERIGRTGQSFALSDADAPVVAEICRRLDGIALALELAASRIGVHGVRGTAALLDKQFRLLWRGRRTALPRHQTLGATLDWSYNLLSPTEQLVLRRLSVFVGSFSLAAALDVAAESFEPAVLTETLATLVDKSLVTSDRTTASRYRLLGTTCAYARTRLEESGEDLRVSLLHCEHILRALKQFGATIWSPPSRTSMDFLFLNLGNLRTALEWSFSERGDSELGAQVVGASACLFLQADYFDECTVWAERAIEALDAANKGTRLELELLACLAWPLFISKGRARAAHTLLIRALDIANRLNDAPMQLHILHILYLLPIRSGDFRGFTELVARLASLAKQMPDPLGDAIAHGFLAVSAYYNGDNLEFPRHSKIALCAPLHRTTLNVASVGYQHRVMTIVACNMWALGYPDQAIAIANKSVQEAEYVKHPFVICFSLMSSILFHLETGAWQRAQELIHQLSTIATKHRLPHAPAALGWQGCLAVSCGDTSHGVELLRTALAALHVDGYELYRPQLSMALATGLARTGNREIACSTICEAGSWAEERKHVVYLPDLLRVKGEILLVCGDAIEGEACLQQSLKIARERGLLSYQLRTGISLAKLWASHARVGEALGLLGAIYNQFTEGFETRDLVAASGLLQQLRSAS
jgi:predicted ATPase/DNA-binding winged helix-turn-helix (wHTH) protein